MATIRQQIITQVVERLTAAQTDWSVQRRRLGGNETSPDRPVTAVVAFVSEDKVPGTAEHYTATMSLSVQLSVNAEDADATLDEGDAYLYADRMVAAVEKAMHNPDEWGPNPLFTDGFITGHTVTEPDGEATVIHADIRMVFRYRHHYQDPEV